MYIKSWICTELQPPLSQACQVRGITFVGPTPENLAAFGDKTSARELAIKMNVPVVPGTDGPVSTFEEARAFIDSGVGYPVIIKAAMGGGGRGMRVVQRPEELEENFARATSEALAVFGDGNVFIERYVSRPRHIEVQILGDGKGNIRHLYDRDCSVQRRYQKVVETAPAMNLSEQLRQSILDDAVRLTAAANYLNAGTVEFLVDDMGRHHFIEVNPRIQVEHTVTEEITGVDLVQTQFKLAAGASLEEVGLGKQEDIGVTGVAMQCRVTTENPSLDFTPDTGKIEVFREPGGMGIRIDDGPGFTGAVISPHYDSLLVKVTAHARNRRDAAAKLRRALREFRVRGVAVNKDFLLNVMEHPEFLDGFVTTSFIAENPDLLMAVPSSNRGQKLLHYIADVCVNGPLKSLGARGPPPPIIEPTIPTLEVPTNPIRNGSLRSVFVNEGAEAFAKAVRANKGTLVTDTTWRDAHQSLLATRMRPIDMIKIAPATNVALANAFSLEVWGGATFDVSMRFLHECPWKRLAMLRAAVPDIPFQMLLRGANAVGYTSYPDNVIFEFCKKAVVTGMDVFRVFDSLNYIPNMELGVRAVREAGGIAEAALCYTGDVSDPTRKPYTLEYYMGVAKELVDMGAHILAVKDMAGLLKPEAATILIGALREEYPDVPIHVHTHDTAGTGVASMLEASYAGADAIDGAMDAFAGTTSQPSLGALVSALHGSEHDTGLNLGQVTMVNDYWEEARGLYSQFEMSSKSGSADVYLHEMPGGQLSNLQFQSQMLGLSGQWGQIKCSYAAANRILGDIPKVTPSSKVVGDLAQFMVQNNLTEQDVLDDADKLSFPESVVEYFQGYLGLPPFGFPEPLRSHVLKGRLLPNGKHVFEGRPGAEMPPFDFEAETKALKEKYGDSITDLDVLSYAQYPAVFKDFMESSANYGDLSVLDTRTFAGGLLIGQEISIELEVGKILFIRLISISNTDSDGFKTVTFELNGRQRSLKVSDASSCTETHSRPKADPTVLGSVGAPMPGVVVNVLVKKGDEVCAGDPLVVLSAMKMETSTSSPCGGIIMDVHVKSGDNVAANDLIAVVGDPET